MSFHECIHILSVVQLLYGFIQSHMTGFQRFIFSKCAVKTHTVDWCSPQYFPDVLRKISGIVGIETAENLSDLQKKIYFSVNQWMESLVQSMQDKDDYVIQKAKELLSSTNLRIYEIALLVGYNEHSHFVRAFKTVTGKSPGEFRESSS